MKGPVFYEDSVPVVFDSSFPMPFSSLSEQHLGLELKWSAWKPRNLEIREDATLIVRGLKKSGKGPIIAKYDINQVVVTHLGYRDEKVNPLVKNDLGVLFALKTYEGHQTQLRLILTEVEQNELYAAIRKTAKMHNLDNVKYESITEHLNEWKSKQSKNGNSSVMRNAVQCAMDSYDTTTRKEHVRAKRGAMSWLPVYFANDLVHGSW
jgi:hypothetical protein